MAAPGAQDGDGTLVILRRLPADEDAPGAGRALAQEMLEWLDHDCGERGENLILCVSELVSNAVVHGPPGEIGLRISVDHGIARVEVADNGTALFDWPGAENVDGHWGLVLVRELSADSGIDRRPWTVAWCELDVSP